MATGPVHLLLIDDDDIEAETLRRATAKAEPSIRFFRARDGLEGLGMLRGEHAVRLPYPLVILLDLNMPRMNGIEFLSALREDVWLRSTIVFVLTTSNAERDRIAAYERNVAGYIVKSSVRHDFRELIEMIERLWSLLEFPVDRTTKLAD